MVGKALTTRTPIPEYYRPVASYNDGGLVVAVYQPGSAKPTPGLFVRPWPLYDLALFVRLGPQQYDQVGSKAVERLDDATIALFVADRMAKLVARRRAEIERLKERLADAWTEVEVYSGRPHRDARIPASVRRRA